MSNCCENQKIKDALFAELRGKEADIENLRAAILRKYGWVESSLFAGWDHRSFVADCMYRWCKAIRGETVAINKSDALQIEAQIEEH